MAEITLGEIKKECGVNMVILNNFLHTFEFHSPNWVEYSKYHYLSIDTKISNEMASFLRAHKKLIHEYKIDFDATKSVNTISQKMNIEPLILLNYLNNFSVYKSIQFNSDCGNGAQALQHGGFEVTNLSEKGEVTLKTRLRNISSYQILKDVQNYQRRAILLSEVDNKEN
ncbi:MAG: hypothetical protein ABJ092_14325 [Gillisia sp.]